MSIDEYRLTAAFPEDFIRFYRISPILYINAGCFSPIQAFDSAAIGFVSLFSAAVQSAAGPPYDGAMLLIEKSCV